MAAAVAEIGREVVRIEREALDALEARIGDGFRESCELFLRCRGKVVVTGIGKSGLVGQKIAATMASTGTPAFFLHPAEGLHGDLGVLSKQDVVLGISNSGESEELVKLLPIIKRMGLPLVAMTGRRESSLAKAADIFLDISVEKEACPFNLAPTASTTVTLALGDAIAVALIKMRGFSEEDFALRHPGGTLGRRLLMTVADVMHSGDQVPLVRDDVTVKDALFEITSKKLGATGVVDSGGMLTGVITDGDLRRALEKYPDVLGRKACEIMTVNPKSITSDALAAKALQVMESKSITALFVFAGGADRRPVGIVHLHDLLKAGVV